MRRAFARVLPLLVALLLNGCASSGGDAKPSATVLAADEAVNPLAERYVRLVLALGVRDGGYVDAYYGPAQWQDEARQENLPLAKIYNEAVALSRALAVQKLPDDRLLEARRRYLLAQIDALLARTEQLQGILLSFDDEARRLYGVTPPRYDEADFEEALTRLNKLLPGDGALAERYNRFVDRFNVPPEQLEPLMRDAIGEARRRTLAHIKLPESERFDFTQVRGQPWTAYNWYQGGYLSRIEVNTDFPVSVRGLIALAAHEGYPGHHVYNALLEARLVRGRGWIEYTVYPLYSPQSLIAEGSADLGAGLAFAGNDYLRFEHQLIERAGLPKKEAGRYDEVQGLIYQLRGAPIETARRYLDGQLLRDEALDWLQRYALLSPERAEQRLRFIEQYRSYIINYSYGEELVRNWLLRPMSAQLSESSRWKRFETLLGEPHTPADLLVE